MIPDIEQYQVQLVIGIIAGIVLLGVIIVIIRYHKIGFLGGMAFIGWISLFTILLRYTNVVLSLEGIFAIGIMIILNYIFINQLLKNRKEEKMVQKTIQQFTFKIIPIIIMAIVFCFISWTPISSFGMVIFWGIVLMAIYHLGVTINLIKIETK